MSNRKQRRAIARKGRLKTNQATQLSKVAALLNQVEGYKEGLEDIADKVKDAQGVSFAQLLCKLAPLVEPAELDEEDQAILQRAQDLMRAQDLNEAL